MKSASQILEMILDRIGSIYERPHMFGVLAFEIDAILGEYHGLWIDFMEQDWHGFREAYRSIHGTDHTCNTSFAKHFWIHTKEGPNATEDEAIDFVIRTWMKMDDKLGINIQKSSPGSIRGQMSDSSRTCPVSEQEHEADYLLDHGGYDWGQLLRPWSPLLPPEFTLWIMNRFGDLFLVVPDGSVQMLDLGGDSLTKLAESRDEFARKADEDDNAEDWFLIPLVDRLVAAGKILEPGRCYSFVTPPILGGDYTVENTMILSVIEHFGLYGSYHEQLKDLPDGTKIVLRVQKPPEEEQGHGDK